MSNRNQLCEGCVSAWFYGSLIQKELNTRNKIVLQLSVSKLVRTRLIRSTTWPYSWDVEQASITVTWVAIPPVL